MSSMKVGMDIIYFMPSQDGPFCHCFKPAPHNMIKQLRNIAREPNYGNCTTWKFKLLQCSISEARNAPGNGTSNK